MWICPVVYFLTLAAVIRSVMPENVSATVGSTAVFPCRIDIIEYSSQLEGRWIRGNSVPGNLDDFTIYDSKNPDRQHNNFRGRVELSGNLQKGQCSLLMKDIRMSDEGTYQFIAKITSKWPFSKFRTESSEVRFSVLSGLIKPTVNSSVVAVEGNSSLLYCTVRGSPPISLRWMKNGEEINSSLTGELKQMFHNMTSEDDGEYWCVAEYNLGTVNSSTQISVQHKPRITVGPICNTSANWTICTCRVRANPPANISWGLNGSILPGISSDVEIISRAVNKSLVQSSLRLGLPTGTGNLISCKAANKHGDSVSKYELHTEDKPRIIVGPICTTTAYWINCTCRIRANPPANITWSLNGGILPGIMSDVEIITWAVNRSLVQSSLRLSLPLGTDNMISCEATSKYGDSISKYQLHTEGIFPWIIFIPVGTVAAVLILIPIAVKVRRKMSSDIAWVPTTNNDSVTYAVVHRPWTTQSHGLDSNVNVRETTSKSAPSEEILYAALSFSNFHKPGIHLQIQEPSEYAAVNCK